MAGKAGRLAFVTLAQNDEPYLSLWVRHAVDLCGGDSQHVYVLDHGSTGDHAVKMAEYARLGVHVVPVTSPVSFSPVFVESTLAAYAQQLQTTQHYTAVIYTAADELLFLVEPAHRVRNTTFNAQFVQLAQRRAIAPAAYELLPTDTPFAFERGRVLRQGNRVYRCRKYARRGLWFPPEQPRKVSERLILLHLHRADLFTALYRHQERALRIWAPGQRAANSWYAHNLITEIDQLRRWAACNADDTSQFAQAHAIPDEWGDWL